MLLDKELERDTFYLRIEPFYLVVFYAKLENLNDAGVKGDSAPPRSMGDNAACLSLLPPRDPKREFERFGVLSAAEGA